MLFSTRSTRRPALLLACAAVGVGALTSAVAAPASAFSSSALSSSAVPASTLSSSAVPAISAGAVVVTPVVDAPSEQQVEEARRAAAESAARAASVSAEVARQQTELDALAAQAGTALETFQQADEARRNAEVEEATQRERLAQAEVVLEAGKKDLGQWASQAYRGGGTLQQYSGMVTVLQQGATDDAASALATVKRIGDGRSNDVLEYQEAQRVQADATTRAADAAAQARQFADQATAAKLQADALVEQQRTKVAELAVLQAEVTGTASSDASRASNLAAAQAEAEAMARAATASGVIGAVGSCTGASLSSYPNGLIPRSALCPLWGAPNHVLRADAANAFEALSRAYAQQFGGTISITDSYRTLAEQIDVKARKPGLAARPGTSRHGLGIAVDLGGGIQSAGSVQHEWMDRNAALYGWINPAWAQNRGGQFEPWHWEYVG